MPLSSILKKRIKEAQRDAEIEANSEPTPIENDHAELFDDDTEVENVQN